MRCFALLCAALWMLIPTAAQADELRPGYLELRQENAQDWQVVWKQPFAAAPVQAPLPPQIPGICAFTAPPEMGVSQAAVIGRGQIKCSAALGGQSLGMPGMIGQTDMLVRIQPLGTPAQTLRLTSQNPVASIAAEPGTVQVLRTYFVLGVEHILAGWDHLLFVIALVLLVQNWRIVIIAATAFTLSHSITLAAAALGFVGLPQAPVEALIALSIVFLAVEIIRRDEGNPTLTLRKPWIVAFLFGLLHGFGFAGALNAIGLPQGDVVAALLAFNVGVEAGQLLVVAAVLLMLAGLRKLSAEALATSLKISSYAIGIIGAYWLVDRVVA